MKIYNNSLRDLKDNATINDYIIQELLFNDTYFKKIFMLV